MAIREHLVILVLVVNRDILASVVILVCLDNQVLVASLDIPVGRVNLGSVATVVNQDIQELVEFQDSQEHLVILVGRVNLGSVATVVNRDIPE